VSVFGLVWVGGNADNDNAILKFTGDGKFVMQIGQIAPSKGSSDTTQLGKPAETAVDKDPNDGLVYVCDRINNRIQVFKKDGTFVKEWFYEKNTRGNGAVWDIAIWPDPKQTYLLSADGENNEIRVLKRDDGTVVGSFGRNGRNAGQFHWIHAMAVDAKGNVYTAEVDTGKRIQKFRLTSDALR
jgi:DNA-binding beta-propeller fold protein YncE